MRAFERSSFISNMHARKEREEVDLLGGWGKSEEKLKKQHTPSIYHAAKPLTHGPNGDCLFFNFFPVRSPLVRAGSSSLLFCIRCIHFLEMTVETITADLKDKVTLDPAQQQDDAQEPTSTPATSAAKKNKKKKKAASAAGRTSTCFVQDTLLVKDPMDLTRYLTLR